MYEAGTARHPSSPHSRGSCIIIAACKWVRVFATATAIGFTIAPAAAQPASPRIVNIYNWSDYIAPSVIGDFTKQTGIGCVTTPSIPTIPWRQSFSPANPATMLSCLPRIFWNGRSKPAFSRSWTRTSCQTLPTSGLQSQSAWPSMTRVISTRSITCGVRPASASLARRNRRSARARQSIAGTTF